MTRRNIEPVVSALGLLGNVATHLMPQIREQGVRPEDLYLMTHPDVKDESSATARLVRELAYGVGKAFREQRRFELDTTHPDAFKSVRIYDKREWGHELFVDNRSGYIRAADKDDIILDPSRLPHKRVVLGFREFDFAVTYEQVLEEFKGMGKKPPLLEHAILFAEQHPQEPGTFLTRPLSLGLVFPHKPVKAVWNKPDDFRDVVIYFYVLDQSPQCDGTRHLSDAVVGGGFIGRKMFAYIDEEGD